MPERLREIWGDAGLWAIFALSALYDWATFVTLGPLSSDEVHNGLAAFQFLDGEWIVFAAQKHLGSIPALLDAPLVWAFGTEDWVLRAINLALHRADLLLVYGSLRLLLGRRAALGGALIFAFPPRILIANLLLATNYGLAAFLWLLGAFLLCLTIRQPSRSLGCGIGIGLASGLALWTTPISVPIVAPLLCAFPLLASRPEALWKRAAVVFGSGLAASLPWWHYNLWVSRLGSFRQDIAFIPPVSGLKGWIWGALGNWRYYAVEVIPSALSPGAPYLPGLLEVIVLILPLALALLLIRSGDGPVGSAASLLRGRQGAEENKRAVFWWWVVLGSIAIWGLAVGFTYPGTIRGHVARYALPFLIWIPFMAGFCSLSIGRGRMRILLVLSFLLILPAAAATARYGEYRQHRRRLDSQAAAVMRQIRERQATYVAGDYWDVFPYTFWTGRQTIGIALDAELAPRKDLPFLQWRPRRGEGLLLVREGSDQQRALLEREGAEGLERLASPAGYSLYRIAPGSPVAAIAAAAE